MFQVFEIESEAKKVIGTCSDELFFRWMTDALSMVMNKLDANAFLHTLDICSTGGGRCVTLPPFVQTVLAVNICHKPTLAKSWLFNMHLNGPGEKCGGCEFSWLDQLDNHSTYRDLTCPSKLVAYTSDPADNGSEFLVHGYASDGNKLRHVIGGDYRDGLLIPTIYGYAIPASDAPTVARITGVTKAITRGPIRLSTIDDSGDTGTLLGIYEATERWPQYRRILLNRCAPVFTIAYRMAVPTITSRYDRIPLKSRLAFMFAVHALNRYRDLDIASAHSFEADAARLETEAQNVAEAPTYSPVMILDWNGLNDKCDYVN